MCVQNLVPIGLQATTCIPSEGYTHTQTDRNTHTLLKSYIDIDTMNLAVQMHRVIKRTVLDTNWPLHLHLILMVYLMPFRFEHNCAHLKMC